MLHDVCEFCGRELDEHFCYECCELMGEDAYLAALEIETHLAIRYHNLVAGSGTGESVECPTCGKWSACPACPECVRQVFDVGVVTIEFNALKCAICGLGVVEGGPMVGGSIHNSVHPDCLLIDPFADSI